MLFLRLTAMHTSNQKPLWTVDMLSFDSQGSILVNIFQVIHILVEEGELKLTWTSDLQQRMWMQIEGHVKGFGSLL